MTKKVEAFVSPSQKSREWTGILHLWISPSRRNHHASHTTCGESNRQPWESTRNSRKSSENRNPERRNPAPTNQPSDPLSLLLSKQFGWSNTTQGPRSGPFIYFFFSRLRSGAPQAKFSGFLYFSAKVTGRFLLFWTACLKKVETFVSPSQKSREWLENV